VNALYHRALPSTAVNAIWGLIALYGMFAAPGGKSVHRP